MTISFPPSRDPQSDASGNRRNRRTLGRRRSASRDSRRSDAAGLDTRSSQTRSSQTRNPQSRSSQTRRLTPGGVDTGRGRKTSQGRTQEQIRPPARPPRRRRTLASFLPEHHLSGRALAELSRFRMAIVWCILMVSMVGLALNLLRIQVIQAPILQARAKAQQMISLSAAIPRRSIVDRAGNVLAIDKPVYTLYAHPALFSQSRETVAVALAPLLNKPLDQLINQLSTGDTGIRVMDDLAEDVGNRITDLGFDGLELVEQQQRLYPQQGLFSEVVGYVNVDREGQAGIEHSYEEQLERTADVMQMSRAGDGSVLPMGLSEDFLQKDDSQLKLTVDSRIQRATRYALKQQMRKYSAKRGAILVMDAHDGAIRSFVSEPSYDPNQYYNADLEKLKNWVLTDLYEPGSTFKPINVAIALESGAVKSNDVFVDEGAIQIGGWPIQNSDYDSNGGRGAISVTEILQYSSNVGMVHIMQQLQPGVFYGWLDRLKLDQQTGIDLPFEVEGQSKSYDQFTSARIEPATTAFGQGFSLTPIKMLQLQAMIANGGKMVTPHVVEGLYNAEGKQVWKPDLPAPRPIFSPKTADAVLKMMEQVVLEGTGKVAQIPGYRIGGKTGTAQKASPYGGYSNARITSFVGMLPIEKPRYVVLAVVDEPQGDDAYGGTVAAPAVKMVMEALIQTEHLAPSKPDELEEAISQSQAEEANPSDSEDAETAEDSTDWQIADDLTQSPQGWVDSEVDSSEAGSDIMVEPDIEEVTGDYWD